MSSPDIESLDYFPSPPLHEILIPVALLFALTTLILLIIFFLTHLATRPTRPKSAIVLVYGDIARSPRMTYHALSLSSHKYQVHLIAYTDTPLPSSLTSNPYIRVHPLTTPEVIWTLPWALRAPLKAIWQGLEVVRICLWDIEVNVGVLFVQNPPSIPTLGVTRLVGWGSGCKVVLDWHNTGWSILALRVGVKSPLVRVAKWFESTFGRKAYAHLFVTKALKENLVKEWRLKGKAVVLHDRPPSQFRRTTPEEQHELFQRLTPTFDPPLPETYLPSSPTSTIFTNPTFSTPTLSHSRPALIISSTSYTPDEPFGPLLTALATYQSLLPSHPTLPHLLILITGRGPLLPQFLTSLSALSPTWPDIEVRTLFLPIEDYPKLLGCADVGVSLHDSSSGMDLPMKIVDMFGCGVPVLAKKFGCLGELVKEGENGMVWQDGEELGRLMVEVLEGFPKAKKLDKLRGYFEGERRVVSEKGTSKEKGASLEDGQGQAEEEWSTWNENWDRVVYRGVLGHAE